MHWIHRESAHSLTHNDNNNVNPRKQYGQAKKSLEIPYEGYIQ